MGLSLTKVKSAIEEPYEASFDVPDEFGGGKFSLLISPISAKQFADFDGKLRDVTEKELVKETSEGVRAEIIRNLLKEPVGLDDFPTDSRDLQTRASEYFAHFATSSDYLDRMCIRVWNEYRALWMPKLDFFRRFQSHGQSKNGVAKAVQQNG